MNSMKIALYDQLINGFSQRERESWSQMMNAPEARSQEYFSFTESSVQAFHSGVKVPTHTKSHMAQGRRGTSQKPGRIDNGQS